MTDAKSFYENQPTASVCRIYNEKGEILFLLRKFRPYGWGLPGGKLEKGESPLEACLREVREETEINFVHDEVKFVGEEKSVRGFRVIYVFEVYLKHTPDVYIDRNESTRARWIKIHDSDQNYTKEMKQYAFAGRTLNFVNLTAE